MFRHILRDLRAGRPAGLIGARFHQTVCAMAVEAGKVIRQNTKINEAVLSGGVWQNQILLELAHEKLLRENFVVYTHRQTPANDGGLALGQAVIANHQ
jgi:hydrogenase maturation protein HypF